MKLFERLMAKCRGGIRPDSSGASKLEDEFDKAIQSAEVNLLIQPLQGKSGEEARATPPRKRPAEDVNETEKVSKQARHIENLQNQLKKAKGGRQQPPPQPHSEPRGKGKGKKGARSSSRMPKGLIGMVNRDDEGNPLCYGFNLGTCTGCEPGQRCDKGFHKCCKPGCLQNHSLQQHTD